MEILADYDDRDPARGKAEITASRVPATLRDAEAVDQGDPLLAGF